MAEAGAIVARKKCLEAAHQGSVHFNPDIWGELKRDFLLPGNHGKCVYCEGNYQAGAPSDGEHFRPKAGVTDGRRPVPHSGYYWLAYEWQNLLLSCRHCNSTNGKLNEFPIAGTRVGVPGATRRLWEVELAKEQPILLHPYYDEPQEHLKAARHWALVGTSERGKRTIEICDLNRPALMEARERAFEAFYKRITRFVDAFLLDEDIPARPLFGPADPFSFYLNDKVSQALQKIKLVRAADQSPRSVAQTGAVV